MRSLALLALVLAGSAHPVPVAVERQIAARAGVESYTPARMLSGWHYVRWQYVPEELRVWFTNRSKLQVKFDVTPLRGAMCAAGKQKTFQLAGSKVYWSQVTDATVEYTQQAWRCVRHPSGRWMRFVASSQTPPTKLAAAGLGRIVASGRLIR